MPVSVEESERVRRHARELLTFARAQDIPVVHVILVLRENELDKVNPRIRVARSILSSGRLLSKDAPQTEAQRRGVPHNLEGSIQTEIMPEIGPEKGDYVINNKKTLGIFHETDLEHLLRAVLQVDTVVLMGINTNTCVMNGCFDAVNRGYKVVVISDCVASMYGRDLHILGLENIARCLGWVLTVDEFKDKVMAQVGATA